ncbi:biotin transporter BioY [Lacticaseibacillus sp. GG6-2]
MHTKHLTQVALMVAIMIVLGFFPAIPLGFIPVPLTLQALGIFLAGLLFGAKRGTLAVLIFLALVALGLPFLAGGRGGLSVFVGPTCGYLAGYVLAPAAMALSLRLCHARAHWWQELLVALIAGVCLIDFCGAMGLVVQSHLSVGAALAAQIAFLPGDMIKAVLAVVLARQLESHRQLAPLFE